MVRRAGSVRPRGPAGIVALAAEIDVGVRIVFVGEHVRGGQGKVVGRVDGIAELCRIGIGRVRVVANRAGDGYVQVVRERDGILSVDQGEPDGAGMAATATADVAGG